MKKSSHALAFVAMLTGNFGSDWGDVEYLPPPPKPVTCPTCGKVHYSTKAMSCSAECYKKLRAKQKQEATP